MRLYEIGKIENYSRKPTKAEYAGYASSFKRDSELIGKLGKYDIVRHKSSDQHSIGITDSEHNVLGVINLFKDNKAWRTEDSSLSAELQGQGIMPHLYKFLIVDYDYTLISGELQSQGGQYIWKKLMKFPSVNVYAMRQDGRKKQYSSVFLNDQGDLEGDFDVYGNDEDVDVTYKSRINAIAAEYAAGKITQKDFDKATRSIGKDIDLGNASRDEERLADDNTRLVATKK